MKLRLRSVGQHRKSLPVPAPEIYWDHYLGYFTRATPGGFINTAVPPTFVYPNTTSSGLLTAWYVSNR